MYLKRLYGATNLHVYTTLFRLISSADDDHHGALSQLLPVVLPQLLAFGVGASFFHACLPAIAKTLLVSRRTKAFLK